MKKTNKKYSKQRNYCVSLLRKSKSNYFGNLNEKNVNDNEAFWKTINPFLSDKVRLANKMTLIDNEEIIMGDYNTAKVLNTFFSNIVSNLNIAEYSDHEPLASNISDPILKCVVKYRNHPSILVIGEVCKKHPRLSFSFSKINREEILEEILKLGLLKHGKILISRQKVLKRMRIYLLTSFLQGLMILSKNLIFHPP